MANTPVTLSDREKEIGVPGAWDTGGKVAAPSCTVVVKSVLPVKTYVRERATKCQKGRDCVCIAWFGSRGVRTWKLKR